MKEIDSDELYGKILVLVNDNDIINMFHHVYYRFIIEEYRLTDLDRDLPRAFIKE